MKLQTFIATIFTAAVLQTATHAQEMFPVKFRGTCRLADDGDGGNRRNRLNERDLIQHALGTNVDHGQFSLVYNPEGDAVQVVDNEDGSILAAVFIFDTQSENGGSREVLIFDAESAEPIGSGVIRERGNANNARLRGDIQFEMVNENGDLELCEGRFTTARRAFESQAGQQNTRQSRRNQQQTAGLGGDDDDNGNASARNRSDARFVDRAAEAGLLEVAMGELAAELGSTQEIRDYGQQLVDDHAASNEELEQIAADNGFSIDTQLSRRSERLLNRLANREGEDFDRAFLNAALGNHAQSIRLYQRESRRGRNDDLQAYADSNLPVLQEHLLIARELRGDTVNNANASALRQTFRGNTASTTRTTTTRSGRLRNFFLGTSTTRGTTGDGTGNTNNTSNADDLSFTNRLTSTSGRQ